MPQFDECCVLIPAATLEDFPASGSDYDARGLLAAWTVLWHPQLIAQAEQIPSWYRADSPPEPTKRRLIVIPGPSFKQLPEGYQGRVEQSEGCRWITGADRAELLAAIDLGDFPPLAAEGRMVGIEDFFAAGFASLQIQVMTRRLRYTSNLDEIHLQNRLVDAAKSFLEGSAAETVAALHDVFDALAEERDHYFSSDPHLIDLTLLTGSTVQPWIDTIKSQPVGTGAALPTAEDDLATPLATPTNVLIDHEAAGVIAKLDEATAQPLRQSLASGTIGWAGGGPAADAQTDAMTFAQAEQVFRDAYQYCCEAIGTPPAVYGRFSGSTPADMTAVLAKLGYCGMIPLDFAAGTGHGSEAKVIMQAAGVEMEALTAKPIDAASDAAFLAIGARLGEAIDSGEIATALLVHWPGATCDSFADLRRVASWSLALGRFWKLDDYFRDGEHPYHHGTAQAVSPDSGALLGASVERGAADPISSLAKSFREQVLSERDAIVAGMTQLATGKPLAQEAVSQFAGTLGLSVGNNSTAKLLINPHSVGCRESVTLKGAPPKDRHVFAISDEREGAAVSVDVPACGFVVLRGSNSGGGGFSLGRMLRRRFGGGPKGIAEAGHLQNEFMEVTISSESGGLAGIYSGSARGNRLSMRLVGVGFPGSDADHEPVMQCRSLRVTKSTAAVGCIEASGQILGAKQQTLARFSLRYLLRRGSRFLRVEGELIPEVELSDQPWHNYFAARVAVAGNAPSWRLLLREKIHRGAGRRLVAPLGVLIDEAERQTLVCGDGLAFHRRVDERFLDTLLRVRGETQASFTLHYGIDVPSPVAAAKSLIAPAVQVAVEGSADGNRIGWLVHTSPKDVVLNTLSVHQRNDGRLAAVVRVIQTRSQGCKANLRFFRNVEFAFLAGDDTAGDVNHPLPEKETSGMLTSKEDSVSVPLPTHGVADVVVVFTN